MILIRISDCASLSHWDETPEQIAKIWFDNFKDPSPSLYAAHSPWEEVEAVAAFHMTKKTSRHKIYHVLRIDPADAAVSGTCPNNLTPGNTGVVAVDFRHWQINGSEEQLVRLVARTRQRIVDGEERLRWIGVRLQELHWQRFLTAPLDQVIAEAKRRSRCLINKHPYTYTPPEQLAREVTEYPPTIPLERIRLQAWLRCEDRLRNSRPGTPLEDWETAEKQLRRLYLQEIIGFAPPPDVLSVSQPS